MTTDRMVRVSVRVLEKEYQVSCPVEERSDLLDSAEYLDAKMREVRDSGKVVGLDRIAVISHGRLSAARPVADWTTATLGLAMMGADAKEGADAARAA